MRLRRFARWHAACAQKVARKVRYQRRNFPHAACVRRCCDSRYRLHPRLAATVTTEESTVSFTQLPDSAEVLPGASSRGMDDMEHQRLQSDADSGASVNAVAPAAAPPPASHDHPAYYGSDHGGDEEYGAPVPRRRAPETGRFRCCAPVGRTTLVCGRHPGTGTFPTKCLVGPDWPCLICTYLLIIVPNVGAIVWVYVPAQHAS